MSAVNPEALLGGSLGGASAAGRRNQCAARLGHASRRHEDHCDQPLLRRELPPGQLTTPGRNSVVTF